MTDLHPARELPRIRDKAQALDKLRKNEAKYRLLVEQIPAITYIALLETPIRLIYLSPQINQLGFPVQDWLNDPQGLLKRVHGDDLPRVRETYAQTLEQHIPLRCEYRLVKSDGQAAWYLDEANVVRYEAGGRLCLQGVLVDITQDKENERKLFNYRRRFDEQEAQRLEQFEKQRAILTTANTSLDNMLFELKQANSALCASEERFRSLLEAAGEGMLGLDAHGRCTFVNKAARTMLGYAPEELLGADLHAKIHQSCCNGSPITADEWPVYNAFRHCVPQRSTELFRHKDGHFFPVEYSSSPVKLAGQIEGAVLIFWDVTKSQALMQTLTYQASHDPLTGLINRLEFEQRMERVLNSAHKDRSEHVLCYLDLDHFKFINDSCGHSAGDELLRNLSVMLTSKLRQRDTFARLGGDEFALLFEHMLLDQAVGIAKELCECVRNFRFAWEGKSFLVSVSIGMLALTGVDTEVANVLSAADTACYTAKKKGRNRVHVLKPRHEDCVHNDQEGLLV